MRLHSAQGALHNPLAHLHNLLLRLQNLLMDILLVLAHRLLKRNWIERRRELRRDRLCGKADLRGHDRLGPRWRSIGASQGSHPRPQGVNGPLCFFLLFRRQCLQLLIELGLYLLQEPDQLQGRFRSCLIRQLPLQSSLERTSAVASVVNGDGERNESRRADNYGR